MLSYLKNKDKKKLFISLATLVLLVVLFVMGNMTKSIIFLFWIHKLLMLISLGAFFVYLYRDKYYAWIIFSPLYSILLTLVLEYLFGAS
ncbi:hypothetical protein MNB_SV-13-1435 [hydrothermal vent metagenome]|uniref:Uncharacterized protein n=1 Tax=hydrothermal vent metagenome TaxID=652676 RepID=A0A1W1D0S4_9ZZZZ